MLRRLFVSITVLGALLASATPASAQQDARAFVLWIDATTLDDWDRAAGPFAQMLGGGVATLAGPPTRRDPAAAARVAARTLGTGRTIRDPSDTQPTATWIALAAFSREPVVISGAPDGFPATGALALGPPDSVGPQRTVRVDPQFPGGARTDTAAMARAITASTADLVIAHIPDVLLVEQTQGNNARARDSWVTQTMRRAEGVLTAMLDAAGDEHLVMVISPTPSGPRRAHGIALGSLAITGPGVPSGLLLSASTPRAGLVSLTDIAPTLLGWFGVTRDDVDRGALPLFAEAPPGFAGSALGGVEADDGVERVHALDTALIDAANGHDAAARSFAIAGIVLALLAGGTVLSGRGRATRQQLLPRGWRDGLATASVGFLLYAPALLLADPIPAALLAIVVAVGVRALLGKDAALLSALLACAVLPVLSIAAGGEAIATSTLPTPIAGGLRVRALEPIVLGMIVAGFAGMGALLDRRPQRARAWVWPIGFGIVTVFVAATQGAGGDVGAGIALAPAAFVLAAVTASVPLNRRIVVAIISATIGATGLVTLTFGPALWVHEDPLIPQRAIPSLVGGRVDAFTDLVSSIWLPALVLGVAPIALLALRRRALLGRALWGRPYFRAGLMAGLVAASIALVTVRGGLATAGVTALLMGVAALVPMLAPDR